MPSTRLCPYHVTLSDDGFNIEPSYSKSGIVAIVASLILPYMLNVLLIVPLKFPFPIMSKDA